MGFNKSQLILPVHSVLICHLNMLSVMTGRAIIMGDEIFSCTICMFVESSWNVMAHDAGEGKWRGNWRMEWLASTLHTTSEHGVSSITTADARTSAASSRLNWRPPVDLNGLVRFAVRRNLVSARVPSHFKRILQPVLCLQINCKTNNTDWNKRWGRLLSQVVSEKYEGFCLDVQGCWHMYKRDMTSISASDRH